MKIDIRDVEAVRSIPPMDAALYLRSRGWSMQSDQTDLRSVWLRTVGNDKFEALLPMDRELRDYALRMGELLGVLAIAEGRSQWQVYGDLLTISSDVLRIRIVDAELGDGTLPIEENAQIAQKARDLVLAAACAAAERRPAWHSRKPAQAMEHVRRVRVGQSERGSYVVTVISRITPLLHTQQPLFEKEEPYERKVTQILAQSLQALDRAATQAGLTQEMTAFDAAIALGVNANLCDAVVGLWGGDEIQRSLEFSFAWSPVRPVDSNAIRRVAMTSDRVPVIREAGRQLRERVPLPDFELRGPVVKLERLEGAPTGKVTIVGLLDDRQVRVVVELEDTQYHSAVQAHDQGSTVQVVGSLTKEGRGFTLRNPSEIAVEAE
jgi:hypothetical protein